VEFYFKKQLSVTNANSIPEILNQLGNINQQMHTF